MARPDPELEHLKRLSQWRRTRDRDVSMSFLAPQFQREIARPFQQLRTVIAAWQRLVPARLAAHTRLERLSRGVLHVAVDTSAHLYELDRLLRGGLERQLAVAHGRAGLRRIQLRVAPPEPSERRGDQRREQDGDRHDQQVQGQADT